MPAAYPTDAECKTFLKVSGSGEDSVLAWLNLGVVDFVERYCGHGFVDQTGQTIYVLPEYPNLLGRVLLIDDYDLVAVTSITNGDGETISDYRLLPLNGPPYYKIEIDADAGQYWNRGSDLTGVVTIECTTGYGTAVPDAVFEAILEMVAWLYRSRSSGAGGAVTTATRGGLTIAPSKVPPHILQKLDLYRRL